MTDRDRIDAMIQSAVGDCPPYWSIVIADYLIANGVVVRENGEWISLTECANAGVYCSVCNKKVWKEDYARCNRKNKLRSNFCPNCGADMRKGDA